MSVVAARLVSLALALGLAWGCADEAAAPLDPWTTLSDTSLRRSTLVASLTTVENDYARLRLAHYATGDALDWDALRIWNPPARPLTLEELATAARPEELAGASATALALPSDPGSLDEASLRRLGERAFFSYPVQAAPWGDGPLDATTAEALGLWRSQQRGVGGLAVTRLEDGSWGL